MDIRQALIRIAHEHPETRAHILPMLRKGSFWSDVLSPGDAARPPDPDDGEYIRPTHARTMARGPASAHDAVFGTIREIMALLVNESDVDGHVKTYEVVKRVTQMLLQQAKQMRREITK